MSNKAREAESEALNKLFGQMNRNKEIDAEKRRLQKEASGDKEITPVQTELQAPPTRAHPIVSDYLRKKKEEEEEQARLDKEKRKKALEELEKMEKEAADARERAREKQQAQEAGGDNKGAPEKTNTGLQLTDVKPITKTDTKSTQSQAGQPLTESHKKSEPKKEAEQKAVSNEPKKESTPVAEKAKTKGGFFGVFGGGKKDKQAEDKKAKDVPVGLKKEPLPEQKSEETKATPKVETPKMETPKDAVPVQPKKPVQNVPIKKVPVNVPEGEQKAVAKEEENHLMARGNSGMKMEKPKEEKLPITAIIPMKSDRGSRYDSAMKASNAFRTNVYLSCLYNDNTKEGGYGLVVDMGDKRIIHGMCGHTSDEWEYGFAGAIEAMRICRENNVKEIMFVVLDPLCEILQQNADGLRWGYSYTRSQFSKAISSLKQEAAIGFIPEKLENDFQDLAETIAKTLVMQTQ